MASATQPQLGWSHFFMFLPAKLAQIAAQHHERHGKETSCKAHQKGCSACTMAETDEEDEETREDTARVRECAAATPLLMPSKQT